MIKVFIENEAGSNQKHIYNEKTLKYQKSYTVSRKYPYSYGFVLNTTSDDGDNVDCFILTDKKLKTGEIVKCEPIGMMEQVERGQEDHNILAALPGESGGLDEHVKSELTEFISHVFDHQPKKTMTVGKFLDEKAAEEYIKLHIDSKAMEGSVG